MFCCRWLRKKATPPPKTRKKNSRSGAINFSFEPPAFFGLLFESELGELASLGTLTVVVGTAPVTGETKFAGGTANGFTESEPRLVFSTGGGVTGEGIAPSGGGTTGGTGAFATGGVSGFAIGVGTSSTLSSIFFSGSFSVDSGATSGFPPGVVGKETAGRSELGEAFMETEGPVADPMGLARVTGAGGAGCTGGTEDGTGIPVGGIPTAEGVLLGRVTGATGVGPVEVGAFTSGFCEGATGLVPGVVFVILLFYKASHS